ncbi:hypothetical protein AFM11_15135 [Mycolicibacterium wolinskyi]|uniref:Uncharacterized protein n=1 Tax=Mycolicibacterium wolinskyi TaxID=59750 RepID=A0A132PM94_9MYCO|nr:hypothetical protein [Mycolicibacterium wolinskyi]KWX23162.1 hypothetical protein AFM11_15135 [Mycolicibacterium wolinskyi]
MDSLVSIVVPALVAVLTAAGAVIGIQFRDVDAYERRRGVWQWLLVLLATVATMGATSSASGVGQLIEAGVMAVLAVAAIVLAHVMWRRRVPDAEPRTLAIATAAAISAVVVVLGSTAFAYISNKSCRQVEPLVGLSHQAFILPVFDTNRGPTAGDFGDWAKAVRDQAQQVSPGEVADQAGKLADLADQIADTARNNDKAKHAMLGTQYYEELKPILAKCHIQM